MNIPGFTAETSFYKTSGHYHSSARIAELNANMVQPSLAIYIDGRFVCYGDVTDNGFINCYPPSGGGGGGGGGRPDPGDLACRRCKINCNKKPVSQRAACRANCDDVVC